MTFDMKEGTFTTVRGKAFSEYLVKLGCPVAEAKIMEGSHWKVEVCKLAEKKWRVVVTCKECPEANNIDVFEDGVEYSTEIPLVGKAKVTVTITGANTLMMCTKSELMGTTETTEIFSESGITVCVKHEGTGASFTENWTREVSEEGLYRMVGNENGEEYLTAMGLSKEDFLNKTQDNSICLVDLGNDTWDFTETMGGNSFSVTIKMDEELDYKFLGAERKMLATRVGPGKIKVILKAKDGRVEEWLRWVDCRGKMTWEGHDKKTDKKCKVFYEKYCPSGGTWKPVSITGLEKMASAMGFTGDQALEMANDYDFTTTIKEKSGSFQIVNNSKFTPYNMIIRLDEEFEFSMPGQDEPFKCIETAVGETYTMIQKNSKSTIKIVTKITNSFMITDLHILGTDVRVKSMYTRC